MIVLGIETSTDVCSVGVQDGEGRGGERSIIDQHIHSEKLLALMQELLHDMSLRPKDLDAIAVSIGPGSFTGLRIGLSAAKGLCFSLDRPLVPVPTLLAIAHAAAAKEVGISNILVALDAKKGDFYTASFSLDGRTVTETAPATVTGVKNPGELDAGESGLVLTDRVDMLGKGVKHVHGYCSGRAIAELGLQRWDSGLQADVRSLEPVYLKDFIVPGRSSARP